MLTHFSCSFGGLCGKGPKMSSPQGRLGGAGHGFPVLHRSQASTWRWVSKLEPDSVVFSFSTVSCPPVVG